MTSNTLEYVSPDVLDFTSTNSSVIVFIFNDDHFGFWELTFNQNSSYLLCDKSKNTLTCIVPKSHFKGKESGYYFLMHTNHLNNLSYLYEVYLSKSFYLNQKQIKILNKFQIQIVPIIHLLLYYLLLLELLLLA